MKFVKGIKEKLQPSLCVLSSSRDDVSMCFQQRVEAISFIIILRAIKRHGQEIFGNNLN